MKSTLLWIGIGLGLMQPAYGLKLEWQDHEVIEGEAIGEDITVSRAEVPNSGILGFRGDTVIKAPIGKIFDVLADRDHRIEWVDRLDVNRELQRVSPRESIVYQSFGLPWPIADRDYVYRAKATTRLDGSVLLTLESTTHPESPESTGVRAHLHMSRYVLTPLDGTKTRVEVEIHTDPRGLLPNWLVNIIQKSWPAKTLEGIRRQVKKPFVKVRNLPPVAH